MDVITAGIPTNDSCPIMTRIKAFLVQEATAPVLEHIFRDRSGNAIDLRSASITPIPAPSISASSGTSASSTSSTSAGPEDTVLVRVREFLGTGATDAQDTWKIEGVIVDQATGTVRAQLPLKLCGQSGLYTMSWAFIRDMNIAEVENTVLSVEPNLFGMGNGIRAHTAGCPTVQEIRMQMWDSAAADNALLDDVEFADDQILQAVAKPLQYFNQMPPPLGYEYNTTNFPWRSAWVDAIIGNLLMFAASKYRRNRLGGSAGGINIDDMNKEREYTAAAQMYLQEWKSFVLQKKVELNMQQAYGETGSTYGHR